MCGSEDDIKKTYAILTECNHYFCVSCLESALKVKTNCPYCRSPNIKYITITNDVVIPYSSKIMKVLEIIKSVPRQFIIFTQFGNIITKLINILGTVNPFGRCVKLFPNPFLLSHVMLFESILSAFFLIIYSFFTSHNGLMSMSLIVFIILFCFC